MAYLPTRLRDESDPLAPTSPPTTSAGGIGGGAGQALGTGAATTAPASAPSGFPGIRAYFDVNKDQAEAMGQGLASGYEDAAKKAQDAAAGYPAPPPSAPGAPPYQPPPGTPARPDPAELARQAARAGGALSDPAGRAALLAEKYGSTQAASDVAPAQPGGVYTPGMASFDAALIGEAGYAPVQSALDKWSGVVSSLSNWKPPEPKPYTPPTEPKPKPAAPVLPKWGRGPPGKPWIRPGD